MSAPFPFLKPVKLPSPYHVHDFEGPCTNGECHFTYSVGRYNENRDFYHNSDGRTVHLGIDFGAPAGTPVYAVSESTVFYKGIFPDAGDYGPMVVTQNKVGDKTVYCLYAHLETESFHKLKEGAALRAGQVLAHVGATHENGNWPPHLHFQICTVPPIKGENIPGVAHITARRESLELYPDPQLYFGPLY